jgi:DNA-directed RNA polymerase subunit M/transcription elongation factor TFIIS
MAKKNKLATPEWITGGYDSKADWEKAQGVSSEKKKGHPSAYPETFSKKGLQGAKTFKIRECPKCGSDDVGLVLSNSDSEEGGGKEWECRKCKWKGSDVNEKELTEDELMKYLDNKGEELA